jgi:phenylalanine-4-hydroxylase
LQSIEGEARSRVRLTIALAKLSTQQKVSTICASLANYEPRSSTLENDSVNGSFCLKRYGQIVKLLREGEMNHHAKELEFKNFTPNEHETWKTLFSNLNAKRPLQLHPIFQKGLDALKMTQTEIPSLEEVNKILRERTGFRGVAVEGLESPESFFVLLSERKFPIGNFIRDARDLTYTPAPDVFHDFYGHIPFLADKNYSDFCHEFGHRAINYLDEPSIIKQFETLFWFSVEFPLIKTSEGTRIFGAGIASSSTECEYALGPKPEVLPFDIEVIRYQPYKIDELQKKIFILEEPEQLYGCLRAFEKNLILPRDVSCG